MRFANVTENMTESFLSRFLFSDPLTSVYKLKTVLKTELAKIERAFFVNKIINVYSGSHYIVKFYKKILMLTSNLQFGDRNNRDL